MPRGPTYPGRATRINMLLDTTRVQFSASGGLLLYLLTVAASHSPGHLSGWVIVNEKKKNSNALSGINKKNIRKHQKTKSTKRVASQNKTTCWEEMELGDTEGVVVILVNGLPLQSL